MRARRHLALLFLLGAACGPSEPVKPATLTRVQTEVFAISCVTSACHPATTPQKGLNLTGATHARLVGVPSVEKPSMKLVEAGSPDNSYLMDKLLNRNIPTSTVENITDMPPGFRLEQERLDLVKDWIAGGALDN